MTVERTARIGFVAAVAVLVVVGCVTYRTATGLIDSNARVAHTHEVLTTLYSVQASMTEAEMPSAGTSSPATRATSSRTEAPSPPPAGSWQTRGR